MNLQGKNNSELLTLAESIKIDPSNQGEGIFLFNKKAQKKLDQIAEQITWNLAQARAASGNPVPCDGYSGRKCNRR